MPTRRPRWPPPASSSTPGLPSAIAARASRWTRWPGTSRARATARCTRPRPDGRFLPRPGRLRAVAPRRRRRDRGRRLLRLRGHRRAHGARPGGRRPPGARCTPAPGASGSPTPSRPVATGDEPGDLSGRRPRRPASPGPPARGHPRWARGRIRPAAGHARAGSRGRRAGPGAEAAAGPCSPQATVTGTVDLAPGELEGAQRRQRRVKPGRAGQRAGVLGGLGAGQPLGPGHEQAQPQLAAERGGEQRLGVAGGPTAPGVRSATATRARRSSRRGRRSRRGRGRWLSATSPRAAISSASRPPIELPATWGRSTPSCARNSDTSVICESIPGGVPGGGIGEAPNPGRSTAMTSWCSARRPMTGSHICHRLPIPCMSTSGSPLPLRRWLSCTGPTYPNARTRSLSR